MKRLWKRELNDTDLTLIEAALCLARDQYEVFADKMAELDQNGLAVQFARQKNDAERLRQLFADYPKVLVEIEENEPDDERSREALGLPPLQRDDTPSLDTTLHYI